MHHFEFLGQLMIIGSLAIVIILVFQKFRIPSVIGLIVTGIILGPSGFNVVHDSEMISILAELGVVLLLFTIGLEFSLEELNRLKKIVVFGGIAQMVLTMIAISLLTFYVINLFMGSSLLSVRESVFLGFAFSVSSTAICLKILSEREELDLQYGKVTLGILIFQDIAIVPLMIAVNFLSPEKDTAIDTVLFELGVIVFFGFLIFSGFRLLMPKIVELIASLHAKEVLVLGALVLCFGSAYLASMIGLSLALGAFVAGMIIASSDDSHKIARTIEPFREALTSIFFISVGLLLNVEVIDLPLFITIALGVLLIKGLIVTIVTFVLGYSFRVSIMAGMALAQIGEFSFILSETAFHNKVIDESLFQSMLVIIVVTMIITPAMIAYAPHVAEKVAPVFRFMPLPSKWWFQLTPPETDQTIIHPGEIHAVIIGYGVIGQNVSSVLKATNISYNVLEIDREVVRRMRLKGEPIYYGDSTEIKALERANVHHAKAVVLAINDCAAIEESIQAIRRINKEGYIIVRTRSLSELDRYYKAGADMVVTEKFETSIQIFSILLQHFTIEPELIIEQQESIRRNCQKIFLGSSKSNGGKEASEKVSSEV